MRLFCLSLSLLLGFSALSQDLVPYRKNNLWGYADASGKVVIEPAYDRVYIFWDNGLAQVKKDDLMWLIDKKGNLKTKNGYTAIDEFQNGRVAACRGGKFNWIQGEVVGGNWGYLDENFEEIVPFIYARAEAFKGDYAIVQCQGNWDSWGVIDKVGRTVLECKYPTYSFDMRPFPGIRWHDVPNQLQVDVSGKGEKWKIIDIRGKQVGAPQGGMHGIFDAQGDKDWNAIYNARRKAAAEKRKEITANNNILQTNRGPVKVDPEVTCIEENLFLVEKINDDQSKINGLVNAKNEVIIPFEYQFISSEIKDDMIRVKKNGLFGFYNVNGKLAVECKYYGAEDFFKGIALVSLSSIEYGFEYKGVVDKNGHEFFENDKKLQVVYRNQKNVLVDEYKNEVALPEPYTAPDAASYEKDKYLIVRKGKTAALFDMNLKKITEAENIVLLGNDRAINTNQTYFSLIDLKTGQVLADSLFVQSWRDHSTPTHAVYNNQKKMQGVISLYSGQIVLPFVYKEIYAGGHNHFVVTNEKSQMAIVDTLNNIVRPFGTNVSALTDAYFSLYTFGKKNSEIYDIRTKTATNYQITKVQQFGKAHVFHTANKKYGMIHDVTEKMYEPVYTGFSNLHMPDPNGKQVDLIQMKKEGEKFDLFNAETGQLIAADAEKMANQKMQVLAVKINGKFRFYDTNGKPLNDKTYEDIKYIGSTTYYAVKPESRWGVISWKNEPVLDFIYDVISESYRDLFVASYKGFYGVVDKNKKTHIPFEYDYMEYSGSYAKDDEAVYSFLAERNERHALINDQNQQLTPFELDGFQDNVFTNALVINKNGTPTLYSYSGKCLIEPQYDAIEAFDWQDADGNDLVLVRKGKKMGLYTDNGKMLLPCEYNDISGTDEYYYKGKMYFPIEKNGKKGMLCNNGTISIPPLYDDIHIELADDAGYVEVRAGGHSGLYKNYSRKLTDLEYDDILLSEETVYGNYFPVRYNGRLGVIDTAGKLVATPQYTKINTMEVGEGYVLSTEKGNKKGIMRTNGEVLLRAEFDELSVEYDFIRTAYLVKMDKCYGLFDDKGAMIVPCNYTKLEIGMDDPYVMTFIDKAGKRIGVTSDFKTGEVIITNE